MNKPISNDLSLKIAQVIDEIKEEQGQSFDLKIINLSEV